MGRSKFGDDGVTRVNKYPDKSPLLILLLPILTTAFFTGSVLFKNSPGFRVDKTQQGLRVGEIFSYINPVMQGDLIIRINNLDYHEILPFSLTRPLKNDNPVHITVIRGTKQLNMEIKLKPVSPFKFISSAWPHLILISILLSLGVLSFFRAKTDQPTVLFLSMVSFFSATFSATFPSHFGLLDPFVISLSFFTLFLCNWMAFSTCLHFVFKFPGERDLVRSRKWILVLIYLTPVTIPVAAALIMSEGAAFWGWLQRLRNITLPFMAGAAFVKHFIDYRFLRSAIEKNQVKIITSSYWLSFGPYIIFYLLPNIFFNQPYISFRLVVISGIILPSAYFISLIRYRLLDVDKMISRTVSYFVLIAGLTLSYSFLVIFLKRRFFGLEMISEELFLLYVIAVAILFEPFLKLISKGLDRIFLPQQLYKQSLVPSLGRRIGTCLSLNELNEILTRTLLENVLIVSSRLIVVDEELGVAGITASGNRIVESAIPDLKHIFEQGKRHVFIHPVSNEPLTESIRNLSEEGIELVFPLTGGTGVSGFLMLGPRRDARSFTHEDINLFSTIASQAGLALENIRHYESLIESKKQVEKMFSKVVQSEKMAALGEMSTVLAHEMKNPLGIIRSSAQYLKKNSGQLSSDRELLEYIMGEVDGLTSVIDNMMGLARYKKPEFTPVDLAKKLPLTVSRWESSENHNPSVAIHLLGEKDLPVIQADPAQLQQVFLNCINNAEDAMPDGGDIYIITGRRKDQEIDIQIKDTGCGIPAEHLDHAFKKFFTTKEKGMGIGLPVSRQVIQAHNGTITIRNRKSTGLNVRIRLPLNPIDVFGYGRIREEREFV